MTAPGLIEQMQQPSFYPEGGADHITMVQTHVSYVFLTGDFAYKVKKAVNFGFLDFSSLEKRQHFCQEELRLNRQLSPELYLDVLPITQGDRGYELNGSGTVVEYAIKMRQFPAGSLLSEQQASGGLTPEDMVSLGKMVAQFHRQTHSDNQVRSYGTVAKIRQAIDENYAQTQGYIGRSQTQAQYDATKAFTDRFFADHEDWFQQRLDADKIRECHGDLHLGNMCRWGDRLYLFDRIEFNEPFRFVDTMYDIAFTVMDLEARGCFDLANRFLNTYIEQTGDYWGLRVLPLYLSRQAYVRAKVTSFLLDDPHIDAATKEKAHTTAAAYYTQAWQYTDRPAGRLIIMVGVSGSGKSTVGQAIAQRYGAIHLRSDAVRKHLAGLPLDQRGDQSLYSQEMSDRTYQQLGDLGIALARQGWTVVLDAKYDRRDRRAPMIAAAEAAHIPYTFVHCTAPTEQIAAWLQERQGDVSDATAELLPNQIAQFDPPTPEEKDRVITLDTTGPCDPLWPQLDLS